MPIYSYVCPVCGFRYYDYQHKYVGSRDIACLKCSAIDKTKIIDGKVFHTFRHKILMQRDYLDEKASVMPDWEPGYNVGIDYHYSSKSDLANEIKRRGLEEELHSGGISSSSKGLYGDEEHKDRYARSAPNEDVVILPEED